MQDNQRAEGVLKQETDLMRQEGRISRVQSNFINAKRLNKTSDKRESLSWSMSGKSTTELTLIPSLLLKK